MTDEIVKFCKNCGPLIKDQTWFGKARNEYLCKKCMKDRYELAKYTNKLKSPKIIEYKKRYRTVERPSDLKELRCSSCKTEKEISLFSNCMLTTRYPVCRPCGRVRHDKKYQPSKRPRIPKKTSQEIYKLSWEKNGSRMTNARLKKKYGISLDQYNAILISQNNLCGICECPMSDFLTKYGKARRFAVDHDHLTGAIRKLLCLNCNAGIGNFKESKNLFLKVIEYLEKHQT